MSVLVTGGAGYIGSHVVLELLEAGEEPIVLDDLSTGFREAVPDVVKFVRGDVGDKSWSRG
jgi:UDP-glucose 4-epimerase